jgi:hypothetical protein
MEAKQAIVFIPIGLFTILPSFLCNYRDNIRMESLGQAKIYMNLLSLRARRFANTEKLKVRVFFKKPDYRVASSTNLSYTMKKNQVTI